MIWEDQAHPYLTKPPLTQEALEAWEKRYGLKLPQRLENELKLKNGGCLKPQTFKLGGKIHEIDEIPGVAPGDQFNCLAPLSQWHSGESEGIDPEKQGDPDKLVPLSGDGHWYYCLDYNDAPAGKPRVCFVDLECGYEKVLICNSFDELIAHTYLGDDHPCVSYGTGWESFKVLVDDNIKVGNMKVRNILGIKDRGARLQYENNGREEGELGECTWMADCTRLNLRIEDRVPTLGIAASGHEKSARFKDGRWFNENACSPICVYSRSIEVLMDAFRQLDAMRRRK